MATTLKIIKVRASCFCFVWILCYGGIELLLRLFFFVWLACPDGIELPVWRFFVCVCFACVLWFGALCQYLTCIFKEQFC